MSSSPRLQEFQKASQMLTHTPIIRETKIVALKRDVENGQYRIKAEQVAAKLMRDHLQDLLDLTSAPAKPAPTSDTTDGVHA
jgi:anti-sigma28 factor (negative regulator of flagellin synthesis)